MSFHPALHQHTVLALPSSSSSRSLHFTYSAPFSSDAHNGPIPEIWTSLPTGEWHAVPFTPIIFTPELGAETYEAVIPLASASEGVFEYTFRLQHPDGGVQWLGSEGSNGRIEFVSPREDAAPLHSPLQHRGVETVGKGDQASLSSFELKDGRSDEIESFKLDLASVEGGLNWKESTGLVLERSERIWYLPRQLSSPSPISQVSPEFDTQLLYLRTTPTSIRPDPRILVLLPFSTSDVSSSLRGGEDSLWLRCMRDSPQSGVKGYLAAAWGKDGELEQCVERCVGIAAEVVGGAVDAVEPKEEEPQAIRACTWNALNYHYYKFQDVLPWLDGLKRAEAGAGRSTSPLFADALDTVLLDDGWQDSIVIKGADGSDKRVLRSFGVKATWYDASSASEEQDDGSGKETRREDSFGGSEDGVLVVSPGLELEDVVERIKWRGIYRVGVWMTLQGYWDGLAPEGPIADAFGPLQLWTLKSSVPSHHEINTQFYLPPIERISAYYLAYFTSLKRAGIDFVKVDDQAHQDYLLSREGEGGDAGKMRHEMLSKMREAADEVFGPGTIHCMAGSPRIWGGELALANKGQKSIIRNSDDYFPDTPTSHRFHISVNSFNTLLTRSLQLIPDFDMCQERLTDTSDLHPFGPSYHIPFRAFSPASIYSTDSAAEVGLQHPQGWSALLGWTKKGARLVKTTCQVGAVLEGRISDDVLGNGKSGEAEGIHVGLPFPNAKGAHIGLWHVSTEGSIVKSTIDDKDVAEALGSVVSSDESVVVYLDGKVKEVSSEQLCQAAGSRLLALPLHRVALQEKECKIATIAEIHSLSSTSSASVKIACLGLLDKHTGLAAIASVKIVDATSTPTLKRSPSSALIRQATSTSAAAAPFPRPAPESRLAFLFHCLIHRTASSTLTNSDNSTRTIGGELRSLGRDLLRRPFATFGGELSAVIGFSWAIWLWLGSRVLNGRSERSRIASPVVDEEEEQVKEESVASSPPKGQHLRVELLFVSPRLGFYVQGADSLKLKLDGVDVAERFVSQKGEGVVEVDVEGAWRADGAQTEGDRWVLELEVA